MNKIYLITPALPYANGKIHIGHLLEHIQANIMVRAMRMKNKDILYICGADSHGTAIELQAEKLKKSPEFFIRNIIQSHKISFNKFGIIFDNEYGSTHTESNKNHVIKIFNKLNNIKLISKTKTENFFDKIKKRFLADRMIIGKCPICKTSKQYGDNCIKCGAVYKSTDLLNPKSSLTNTIPIIKKSNHYFFNLPLCINIIIKWVSKNNILQKQVKNSLLSWFKEGLKKWDISRDYPYFGFNLPLEQNKFFYVWLDAPIGYISLTDIASQKINRSYKDYWLNKKANIIHFIGKDIIYFHTLFWPAILINTKYNTPKNIFVHGMLTFNSKKMSKSNGFLILADDFAKYINPEALRYYFAANISNDISDIDFTFQNFINKINNDLVNKSVNLISRTAALINKNYNSLLSEIDYINIDIDKIKKIINSCYNMYIKNQISEAITYALKITEIGNKYLHLNKPWLNIKDRMNESHMQLSTGLWLGKICIGLLKPIMPQMANKMENLLNLKPIKFNNIINLFPINTKINKYENLFERLDLQNCNKIINKNI